MSECGSRPGSRISGCGLFHRGDPVRDFLGRRKQKNVGLAGVGHQRLIMVRVANRGTVAADIFQVRFASSAWTQQQIHLSLTAVEGLHVLSPKIVYKGHQLISPVASGMTPIQPQIV